LYCSNGRLKQKEKKRVPAEYTACCDSRSQQRACLGCSSCKLMMLVGLRRICWK